MKDSQNKAETNGTITVDQIDAFTLPLGKAMSVLEMVANDLPGDEANCVYAAQDLIRASEKIVAGWVETRPSEKGA